jgi:hypothetical protein
MSILLCIKDLPKQVLLLTGIGQIRYLNRALMRFDSKVRWLIPLNQHY